MQTHSVPVGDLKGAEYNPRHWSSKATSDLKESIRRFGIVDPIIANGAEGRKNIVIGGHFRLHCAKELGYTEVPVVYVDISDIEKEKELNLRLNRNTGDWDYSLLANFDESLLMDSGFSSDELDRIFNLDEVEDDFDADAEAAKITDPKSKRGEVYQLGVHRLMCGDATDAGDVALLMDGRKADMVFTDPPYNVDYSGRGEKTSNKIKNDNLSEDIFRGFLIGAFRCMRDACTENAPVYICYSPRTHREFEDALNDNGYRVRNQIIWVKTLASMGWGDYRGKHEPILYATQHNVTAEFYGDRRQYTEWREELSDIQLLEMVKKLIEKDELGASTVWRLKRDTRYNHPTQKPLQLVKIALFNSSQRGDCVLDLFAGGGSTLMACEHVGRECYTLELDPRYVDVVIARYEKETGNKAQLCQP